MTTNLYKQLNTNKFMVTCEMCGKDAENLNSVKVAGSLVRVCSNCRHLGKSQEVEGPISKSFFKKKNVQVEMEVVPKYTSIITSTLAKKGLDLHQLARVISIKESTLNKFMSGKFAPELDIAKRIGHYLEIPLVREVEVKSDSLVLEEMNKEDKYVPENLADMIMRKMKEGKDKK